ncbi:MAG TPA: NAD(P)-dependent oxidoreductase [Gemmatimonadaceae bacterium]|nr:NAD(P)-dependent oxidoreductase [Gemmatimonadaceae bacterium]
MITRTPVADSFDNTHMHSVAFLGLGAIGTPMATHLAPPATTLAVWNRTASRAQAFAERTGARAAATPADAALGAEFVITCFPTSRDVESILDGPDGLLAGMARNTILVDCTSGDPATSRRIAERLAARGIGFIDAPVSGGVNGAEKGVLTIMVGGDPALLERARPVLEKFGKKIVSCGPVGAGDALKAVNNALLATHIWSLAEGLAALERAGVAPAVALDVINASSGRSNTSENLFPTRVLNRAFPRTFRLALLDKDVGIAAGVAKETNVPAQIMELTSQLFRAAHADQGEEADHVEAVKYFEKLAGGNA